MTRSPAARSGGHGTPRRFPWPEELVAAVYVAGLVALFLALGWPFTVAPMARAYLAYVGALATFSLPLWLVVRLWRAREGRASWRGAAEDVAVFLRAVLPFIAILVAYTNLKSRMLLLHPMVYDRELGRLDAWLHFGGGDFLGWVLSTTHDRGRMTALLYVYFYAWLGLVVPFAVAFARAGAVAARRTLAALGLAYVAGGFLYVALPAVGPAFFDRARFAHLDWSVTWHVQQRMLAELRVIVAHPESDAVPFFGIAAFPSLHLATTALGCFVAWRWCRWLLPLLVPFNLAVAWSAVAWGWHYAIDFYPGFLLAAGAWWVAGRWTGDPPPAGAGSDGARPVASATSDDAVAAEMSPATR